ncbi:MAG: chorismate mutase [Dehalococcoidia bacterium]
MWCRGIRGATTVVANTRDDILAAARELLGKMVESNGVEAESVASMVFTTTSDLNAEFPAVAAREMGFSGTALLCTHEMNVPDSLPRCLRVLILVNTEKSASDINHVYIRGAEVLRSDIGANSDSPRDDRGGAR